jgi:hypothetical protein
MKTISDVQAATDAELIAFWNKHNPKQFDKMISDRAKFVEWCIELVAELAEEEANGETVEAGTAQTSASALTGWQNSVRATAAESIEQLPKGVAALGLKGPQADQITAIHEAGIQKLTDELVEGAAAIYRSNSAGISASWANPAVKEARLTRNGARVVVGGVSADFKSVSEAFRAYRLPLAKHIRFRMRLKESKAEVFEHEGKQYHFTII